MTNFKLLILIFAVVCATITIIIHVLTDGQGLSVVSFGSGSVDNPGRMNGNMNGIPRTQLNPIN
ncbi:TPA: hypothetical protein ACIKY6_001861 [Campylobacter jejuni]